MSIRPDDTTFPKPRRVILAGANPQALSRLISDVLPLLELDDRLGIGITVIPGSRFEGAAHEFLRERGLPAIDWSEVRSIRPDLIISCTPSRELFWTRAKFMVIPHGAAHNRKRADFGGRIYGLAPQQIRVRSRLLPWLRPRIPDLLALAGEAGLELLRRNCPAALPNAEIIGDLCLERMRLSDGPEQRRRYREALGIERGQIFVVVSSTWGNLSLIGRGHLHIASRLLATLPMDRFRVGVIPHPNIRNGVGARPEGVLAEHLANGLMMPPVHESWRAMLIAADVVIGDSGSVTQYAAAIGKPVLLGAFGFEQMTEGMPLWEFGEATPSLELAKPFAPQLLAAVERGQPFDFGRQFSYDVIASEALLAVVYEMLDTAPPKVMAEPKHLPPPETVGECRPTAAWNFRISFSGGRAHWKRLPASRPEEVSGLLVARTEFRDPRLLTLARVLLCHDEVLPLDEARAVLEDLRLEWPHSLLRSVRTGRGELLIAAEGRPLLGVRCDPRLLDIVPAALHVWLTQQAADPPRLDAADALVGLQRCFEPPPTFVAVEQ